MDRLIDLGSRTSLSLPALGSRSPTSSYWISLYLAHPVPLPRLLVTPNPNKKNGVGDGFLSAIEEVAATVALADEREGGGNNGEWKMGDDRLSDGWQRLCMQ
ncbi:hypothetical protein ACLOJK_005611 [Asimina triloba]